MNEIALPHSIDAEQAVLGGLMLSPEALAKIDWLSESDFFRHDHAIIFRAIADLIRRGEPCDPVTLGEWFEANATADQVGGFGYVVQLGNSTPSAANITAYAEIVLEKSRLRQVVQISHDAATGGREPRGRAAADIIAEAMHQLSQLQTATYRGGLVESRPILQRVYQELLRRYEAKPSLLGLPTPWRDLNDFLKGLRNSVLYVVGARPSMGKTVFGLQLAAFTALRGEPVAVFSAEMTADECMARMLAASGDLPHSWIEQPMDGQDSEIYWPRLTDVVGRLHAAPLLIDETPAIRIDQLMARARKAHLQRPLRLIVVDHLHDMDHGKKPEAIRHEIGRAVQGLKTLAKELQCPVVCLAQLNRGSANRSDKRPTLVDLREAGDIEQKADVVMFLHREDYYTPDTHLRDIVEVIPAKGRNIRLGAPVHLAKRFERMRMDDLDGPVPEPPASKPSKTSRGFMGAGS